MKVLQVSMSDSGGAGIAAVRLHEALLDRGVESKLLTLKKTRGDIPEHYVFDKIDAARFRLWGKAMSIVDRLLKRLQLKSDSYARYRDKYLAGRAPNSEMFSFPVSDNQLENHPLVRKADIVHLHWVSGGLMDFYRFFTQVSQEVVWTLHDMNPFTGGCHYVYECLGYKSDCNACPQLEGTVKSSVAKDMLSQKRRGLDNRQGGLSIVTPSKWLMNCSKESKLFSDYPHSHIYNIVNADSFFMTDKTNSREKLSLPVGKKIVLCIGSLDYARKGNHILVDALALSAREDIALCSVGSVSEAYGDNSSIVQLGYIADSAKMRDVYNAADIFILPTMADNFPNTIVESLLCGTPVASFDVGGVTEQVNDQNGLLVHERSPEAMASALDSFFDKQAGYDRHSISRDAHDKYAADKTVDKHLGLYEAVLHEDRANVAFRD